MAPTRRSPGLQRGVSILVVLDLGHWLAHGAMSAGERVGFNPCCLGSRSLARKLERDHHILTRFQSLLSWISVIGKEYDARRYRADPVSILVVLDLGHWPDHSSRSTERCRCFNPCCLGSRSLAIPDRRFDWAAWLFQSLLSWISVIGNRSWSSMRKSNRGFNPCCLGSRSLAVSRAAHRLGDAGFQSLLSWISVIGAPWTLAQISTRRVSILVVLDLGHWPALKVAPFVELEVSILVVLDLGHWPPWGPKSSCHLRYRDHLVRR